MLYQTANDVEDPKSQGLGTQRLHLSRERAHLDEL